MRVKGRSLPESRVPQTQIKHMIAARFTPTRAPEIAGVRPFCTEPFASHARPQVSIGGGGGNVLTHDVAHGLPKHPAGKGARVVYGEACRLGPKSLEQYGITFRQIPFELKVD